MAIEVTDEIRDAFEAAAWPPSWVGGDPLWEDGLAAALAIVERDQEADVVERLSLVYCEDCGIRMFLDTRHPHELIPVTVTVARRRT